MNVPENRCYTVLIVEDEQIVRETLAADPLFESLGLRVIASAENGRYRHYRYQASGSGRAYHARKDRNPSRYSPQRAR